MHSYFIYLKDGSVLCRAADSFKSLQDLCSDITGIQNIVRR